jgi:hypothetical protein
MKLGPSRERRPLAFSLVTARNALSNSLGPRTTTGTSCTCNAWANAKNQFGGYAGFMPFKVWMWTDGRVSCNNFCLLGDFGGNQEDQLKRVIQSCQKAGYFEGLKIQ